VAGRCPLAGKKGETVMLAPYPKTQPEKIDEAANAKLRWQRMS